MASPDPISAKFLCFVAIKVPGDLAHPLGVMILDTLTIDHDCLFARYLGTQTASFIFQRYTLVSLSARLYGSQRCFSYN